MIQSAFVGNGVALLLDRVPHTRVASVGFWFRVGSRDEVAGQEGFAHFLEHMLFKGTTNRNARQIALDVDRVGGFLNAFTEKEITCYHCTVPREALGLAVDVLADMVRRPLLDPADIEKEKKVIASEISAAEDAAEDVAHEMYVEALFRGHPLARRITGTVAQVKKVSADALEAFYRERYGRTTLLVGLAGDIEMGEAQSIVGEALAGWEAAGTAPDRSAAPVGRCWAYRRGRSEQLHFYTGIARPGSQGLRDYYVSLVFSTLVGESMSSRLFQSLRETHALCYTVASFRTQLSDASLWTIYASTTPAAGGQFLSALSRELDRLRAEPPGHGEVDDAKSHLRGSLILAQEDAEMRMKRMVRQTIMVGRTMEYEDSLRELDRVSREDVARAVEDRIRGDGFNLLVYGHGLRALGRFRYAF
jgi:predicted Zn-dependent peptidase